MTDPYRYDLFFSYARKDNASHDGQPGWITAFHIELDNAIRAHGAPGDHRIFFDTQEIKSGEDWEQRIRSALRDSCLMLAFVSPNYLNSEWCRKEWQAYILHEHARRVEGQGVHPIYFIEVPGLNDPSASVDKWIADLKTRQTGIDLRRWQAEGIEALRHAELQRQIAEFEYKLYNIQRRMRAAGAVEGTAYKARSTHFVGRKQELRKLSHLLTSGTFGVLTAVHGWPGVGKTAIAAEYAHSHAARYSAGTWLLRCANKDRLVLALSDLEPDLAIEFTEDQQKDADLKVRRIFLELEKRVIRTKEDPDPACLLIFDNVDNPALFSAPEVAQLPPKPWLHLLVTTRLGETDLPGIPPNRFLPIDELEEADALRLIETLQRGGRFTSDDEREAARWIVNAVRRLALEVEGVAVYLGAERDVTCRDFQSRLEAQGLTAAEEATEEASGQMLHRGKRLSAVFGELFTTLSEQERYVLDCAALLPPDYVALPWLEALARQRYPELTGWKKLVRKLLGRRLLTLAGEGEWDGNSPLVRMHRTVQQLLLQLMSALRNAECNKEIDSLVVSRIAVLESTTKWADARWELEPLDALARTWADVAHPGAGWLLSSQRLEKLSSLGPEVIPILRQLFENASE
jgi:hypothetical protein